MPACKMKTTECVVCGDAGATKHYGRPCCSGCKGFFRRSVRFRRQYVCTFSNACNVRDARNSCRACRLRICLEAGLQPTLVHSDRACDIDAPRRGKGKQVKVKVEKDESLEAEPKKMNMPLGVHSFVPAFDRHRPTSVIKFLHLVDNFIDSYYDDSQCILLTDPMKLNLDVEMHDAFMLEPRKLCGRTMMLWQPRFILNLASFKAMWCRLVVHYVDWATHLPQLKELDADDRLRVIVGRCVACIWHILAHRSLNVLGKKQVLMSGGAYFPLDEQKLREGTEKPVADFCKEIGEWLSDSFFEPIADLNVTETELVILRAISLFQVVPSLSKRGKEVVREAQAFYRNTLLQSVRLSNPLKSEREVSDRVSELLSLLPALERTNQIEDNHLTVMTMFNVGELNCSLTYDFYVRRKMRL